MGEKMKNEKCQVLLEKLVDYSLGDKFQEEMQTARKVFEILTGKVNDDDYFYEQRMNLFHDYFLFDFRIGKFTIGATMFEYFIEKNQVSFSPVEIQEFEQLRSQRCSLFRLKEIKEDKILVYDYFTKETFWVYSLPKYSFIGFSKENIFEARVVNYEGVFFFTGGFVFHNPKVSDLIEYQIKQFMKGLKKQVYIEEIPWHEELKKRTKVIDEIEREREVSEKRKNRRAIDLLNLTKKIAEIPRAIRPKNILISLGEKISFPVFVKEEPLYNISEFLEDLLYCEIQMHRYKHLDGKKIYKIGFKK